MRTHDTQARSARAANERGAVLVEFSLVVVIFVALLYGLIAYGMAFALKESMTNAASEAARSAVGSEESDGATAAAYDTAKDRLGWLGDRCCDLAGVSDPSDGQPMLLETETGSCPGAPGRECIKVTATYDYESSPLVPVLSLPGFSHVFPDKIEARATVQYDED